MIIKKESFNALNKLQTAKITEKQTIYIINTVILTRLAYRIQNTFFSENSYTQITNKYTNIAKHKAELATSILSSTIFNHKIYALKKAEDIQLQQHFAILVKHLNHIDFTNSSLKIRLQQLQNSASINKSILSNLICFFDNT